MGMKLHPISIPYRIIQGAPSILVLIFFLTFVLGQAGVELLIPIASILVITGIALVIGWEVAYYKRFEYELDVETFDIRSGVISRRNREIPYRRVQNVDISRSLVQRALGIATVRLETAGGGESEALLRYVGYDEAKRLQEEIRARTRRIQEGRTGKPTGERETAPEGSLLYKITDHDLGVLAVASFDLRVASILLVLLTFAAPGMIIDALQAAPIDPLVIVAAAALVVVILSAILSGTSAIVNNYDFTLTRFGDELRYERGLLQRYDGSIPLEKVQTLILGENVIMRHLEYASLTVETAGYAPGQGAAESARAVPISKRAKTVSIGKQIESFREDEFNRPASQARIRYAWQYTLALLALTIGAYGVNWWYDIEFAWWGVLLALPLVPLAAHFKWRHRGYCVTDNYVLMRSGFWRRRTHIVPFYRLQTVDFVQSILQRRWGIATVVLDTAGSSGLVSGHPTAYDLDQDEADRLHDRVAEELHESVKRRKRQKRLEDIIPRFDAPEVSIMDSSGEASD